MAKQRGWQRDWRERIWCKLKYLPSVEQLIAHNDTSRTKLVAGGERGGKSRSAAMHLVRECADPMALFWIVGPTYDLARPEFLYAVEALTQAGVVETLSVPKSGMCSLRTAWGAEIITRSADDPEKLAAKAPTGVLLCEAAQCTYETYLRLRGRIGEKRGWLWMSGTFEGSLGWYSDYWNFGQGPNDFDLRSFSLPTWSNLAVYPGGRDDPEIKALEATYPPDRFQERFGAVPCPPHNLVFREFSHVTHVGECLYDARLPVEVWVDPGWAHAYAVLAVQYHGDEVWIIDEVYERGMSSAQMVYEMLKRPWGSAVHGGVIDVAGQQHANTDGKSAWEVWLSVGKITLRSQPVGIRDGIDRTKTFLADPMTGRARLFVDTSCKNTIKEFGQYRYALNSAGDPRADVPIDLNNDAMKAIAYGLVDKYGACATVALPPPTVRASAGMLRMPR